MKLEVACEGAWGASGVMGSSSREYFPVSRSRTRSIGRFRFPVVSGFRGSCARGFSSGKCHEQKSGL